MSSKEDILKKYRANIRQQFDMPDLSDINAITYPDPLLQFMNMTKSVGGNAIEVESEETSTNSSVSYTPMPKRLPRISQRSPLPPAIPIRWEEPVTSTVQMWV